MSRAQVFFIVAAAIAVGLYLGWLIAAPYTGSNA